jgi:hypothetical protein
VRSTSKICSQLSIQMFELTDGVRQDSCGGKAQANAARVMSSTAVSPQKSVTLSS